MISVEPSERTLSLGGGRRVPYPVATSDAAARVGRANRRTDTKPEVRLRAELHRRGLRFRKDHPVRVGDVRVRPDIVFTRWRLAVFVDGCFWHSCPEHGTTPKSNVSYWSPKLASNRARDLRVAAALEHGGWRVVRLWEHEPTLEGAAYIEATLLAIASATTQI